MFLPPKMAVEFVSEQVEHGHYGHVKKEEGHQACGAEASEKGIHPNSNGQIHPDNPAGHHSMGEYNRLRNQWIYQVISNSHDSWK